MGTDITFMVEEKSADGTWKLTSPLEKNLDYDPEDPDLKDEIEENMTELPDELNICVTNKVSLRLMCRDDSKEFYRMVDRNRSDLRIWLTWVDEVTSEEDIKSRYDKCSTSKSEGKSLRFFVLHKGSIIGMLAAKRIDWESSLAELSYSLDPNFRGCGIMTKACRKLIGYLESSLEIRNFEIHTAIGNQASERVAEKLGFKFNKIQEKAERLHSKWIDHKIYVIDNRVATKISNGNT